ncbi:unnamed protein product [Rhizophagus irregularis]|nr:unnamed protein product [Rhizophagus irregularis]
MINNNTSSTGGSLLAVIAREDEEMIILENIIDIKNNDKFLYLEPEPKPNWKFFEDKLKLEYGRSVTLEKVNKPTKEFIEAVKDVMDSEEPRKFKDIINDFGQFIPKEVILGGRAYFIARENSEENSGEYVKNTDCQASNIKIEKNSSKTLNKSNSSKYQSFKLFGGKEVCSNNFNEPDWIESLRDFRNWSCIKFKDPVNIFQLLPKNLRSQILLLVGKKILYINTEYYTYYLFEPRTHHTFKLNIPENILKILQHKDAECSIFSTVLDEKGKDIFN